jgi:hypothetical protein
MNNIGKDSLMQYCMDIPENDVYLKGNILRVDYYAKCLTAEQIKRLFGEEIIFTDDLYALEEEREHDRD